MSVDAQHTSSFTAKCCYLVTWDDSIPAMCGVLCVWYGGWCGVVCAVVMCGEVGSTVRYGACAVRVRCVCGEWCAVCYMMYSVW